MNQRDSKKAIFPVHIGKERFVNSKMSEERVDIRYELIPYDGFIGSQEFDFDKTIYDLNSQIELLSSHADNLDYVVAIASGIACGLLDILWVGEFDLAGGRQSPCDVRRH